MADADSADLVASLKRVATVLRDANIRYALAGSGAVFARGGTFGAHDVDFVVHVDDVDKALAAAADAGLRTERPPEDWLVKVYDGDVLVDLIFRFRHQDADDAMLGRCTKISVLGVEMPVLDASDIVVAKLLAMSVHNCDFAPPLLMVRVLREQIDWDVVDAACAQSPFAQAFLVLVRLLGIAEPTTEPVEEPCRATAR
jgi:hypothetical protein